ncbi:hypothetical protein CSAL01_06012 [Colletotrichum salicis]|uniref:Uncharacterized protein n=1 Tax=Colletotrichum salicis TaxID=1209931 RepID=A0A135V913_9PEZI|nr:hypothetical protein CSAL01_06012 [Colletotrichum salicis]
MVYYCCVWRWKEEVVGRAHDSSEVTKVAVAAATAGTAVSTGAEVLEVVPKAAALAGAVVGAAGGNGPVILRAAAGGG